MEIIWTGHVTRAQVLLIPRESLAVQPEIMRQFRIP
jgi:hypothetical protein